MFEESNPPKEIPISDDSGLNSPRGSFQEGEEEGTPRSKKHNTLRSFRLSLRKKKAEKIFDEGTATGSISSSLSKKNKEET